jgi:hypothetical protein
MGAIIAQIARVLGTVKSDNHPVRPELAGSSLSQLGIRSQASFISVRAPDFARRQSFYF